MPYIIEYSLTRRERELLAALTMAPLAYAEGRNWTSEMRALLERGLIFSSRTCISITERGRGVAERVG